MRDLKFRAWDKIKKEWILGYEYETLRGFSLFGEIMLLGEWANALNKFINKKTDLEVMQFTGLKDKNNVAIYEDDILKVNFYDKECGDKMDFVGIVCWDEFNLQFRVGNEDEVYEIWNDTDLWTFEVLGNIYENNDLLTNK